MIQRMPVWQVLFQGFFVVILVDGLFANMLYPATLPVLFKDIYLSVMFVFFAITEHLNVTLRLIRRQLTDFIFLFALLFGLYVILQMFNPHAPGLVLGLLGLKTYFLYWLLVPMGYAYLSSNEDAIRLFKIIVLASIPINLFGLYQFMRGPEFLIEMFGFGFERAFVTAALDPYSKAESFFRIIGTFASTGQYSNFLYVNAVLCFCLLFWTRKNRDKGLWIFCLALNFLCLLASGSRGSMLMLVAIIIVMGTFLRRARTVFVTAFLVAGFLYMGFSWLGEGVQARFQTLSDISMIKMRTVGTTGKLFTSGLEKYPMGRGPGSASTSARYLSDNKAGSEWVFVENYPSKLQVELGLVGVFLYMMIMFAFVARWLNYWLPRLRREDNIIGICLSAYSLCSILFLSFFGIIDTTPGSIFLCTFIGMIMKLIDLTEQGRLPRTGTVQSLTPA